jgi:hypothetical protein
MVTLVLRRVRESQYARQGPAMPAPDMRTLRGVGERDISCLLVGCVGWTKDIWLSRRGQSFLYEHALQERERDMRVIAVVLRISDPNALIRVAGGGEITRTFPLY